MKYKLFFLTLVLLLPCLAWSAPNVPLQFFSGHGAIFGDDFHRNQGSSYFTIGGSLSGVRWNLYKINKKPNAKPLLKGSGNGQVLAVNVDGSVYHYNELSIGEYGDAEHFSCSISYTTLAGQTTSVLSFNWPGVSNAEVPSNLSLDNGFSCPNVELYPIAGGRYLMHITQLNASNLVSNEIRTLTPARFYVVTNSTITNWTSVAPSDLELTYRGNGAIPEGVFWSNAERQVLYQIVGPQQRIGLFDTGSGIPSQFILNAPYELIGIAASGVPLVSDGQNTFERQNDGTLTKTGTFIKPTFEKKALIFEDTNASYDTYHSQYPILLNNKTGLSADANCRLPNSFPWRITKIIGLLSRNRAIAIMSKDKASRLVIINVNALQKQPLYCNSQLTVSVLGGAECQKRTLNASYGQRLQSSEYETLPKSFRCGFKVQVYDSNNRPLSNFPVVLIGKRYIYDSDTSHTNSLNQRRNTGADGSVLIWVDITDSLGFESSELFVVSPYGDAILRSTGVLVYDRYSHL